MNNPFKKYISADKMTSDDYRYRIQMILVPALLGIIAIGMSVLNIVTKQLLLLIATSVFSVCSIATAVATCKKPDLLKVSYVFYSVLILALFTYFLIYGGADGFSTIWILLLPSCGLLLFGLKRGTVICGVMFAEIVCFLWTAPGNLLLKYNYGNSFRARFPLVYIAFFLIGYIFEFIRKKTHDQLYITRKKYRELSVRDALTGIYNRLWFNAELFDCFRSGNSLRPVSMLMIDIDHFKDFNDNYGHQFGDLVLIRVAQLLGKQLGDSGNLCRWGGEEFAVLLKACSSQEAEALACLLHQLIKNYDFKHEGKICDCITISIGVSTAGLNADTTADQFVSQADNALYHAKKKGRDCVVVYTQES